MEPENTTKRKRRNMDPNPPILGVQNVSFQGFCCPLKTCISLTVPTQNPHQIPSIPSVPPTNPDATAVSSRSNAFQSKESNGRLEICGEVSSHGEKKTKMNQCLHGNPSYPPKATWKHPRNSRPYDQGLLTIGFP